MLRSLDGIHWNPAGFMGGSTLYALIRTDSAIGPENHTLLAVGADGTILTAREDPAVGIRIRSGPQGGSLLASKPGRLHIRVPDFLGGRPVRLTVYEVAGVRRLEVRGQYSHETVLPLHGLPGGRYILEIQGKDKRIAESFRVTRP